MDDNTRQTECETSRERAERVFEECLDDLVASIHISQEHLDEIRKTEIELGSEELGKYLAGQVPLGYYSHHYSLMQLATDLAFWKNGTFCYKPVRRKIVIGRKGEDRPPTAYKRGIAAELGHATLHSAPHPRGKWFHRVIAPGVDEYYELALSWMHYDRLATWFDMDESVGLIRLAPLYLKYVRNGRDISSAVVKAREEVCSSLETDGISVQLEEKLLEAGIGEAFEHLGKQLKEHVEGMATMWELTEAIMDLTGCSPTESLAYHTLVAGIAMYDRRITFSSRRRFLRSMKQRLPEYLSAKTS